MAPTIALGEKVTVDYTAYAVRSPQRWDVVVFTPLQYPNQNWVMRVIGLPGETIGFSTNGITINGRRTDLPQFLTNVTYVEPSRLRRRSVQFPYRIPQKSYFLLGDNSLSADDSRFWGAIPATNIVGKVKNK